MPASCTVKDIFSANLWTLFFSHLIGQCSMDELHQRAVHLWLCGLLRGRSRSHPLVLCSWAVLSGSKAGCNGCGRLFQLDCQLHHWHVLPICCCKYFLPSLESWTSYTRTTTPFMSKVYSPSFCVTWLPSSSEPMWAIRLPDLRSTPSVLPHLHILPGTRDSGQDLRPDRSKLPPALSRRNDGYGHGPGQAQHRAGLPGGGKHQLKSPCLERNGTELSLGWTLFVGVTPNFYFLTCILRSIVVFIYIVVG